MSSHYPDEWAERMHSALAATDKQIGNLKEINNIAAALYGAASDIRSDADLRTVVKVLSNEIGGKLRSLELIERHLEDGLRLPEAEQVEYDDLR